MKSMRVAAFSSLITLAVVMLAVMSLHAKQTKQDVQMNAEGDHPNSEIVQQVPLAKHELFSEDHTADAFAVETVWSAYVFYNDSHNGPGIASIFTPDAVIHFVWNDHGKLVPEFGINPYQTPEGMNGGGCVLTGRKQFAQFYGYNRDVNDQPLALPGPSHHFAPNKMVKVSDDGKTAMLTASWFTASAANGPSKFGGTGVYRAYFRKTSEGWEIAKMYGIGDRPSDGDKGCDLHGPIPRPKD